MTKYQRLFINGSLGISGLFSSVYLISSLFSNTHDTHSSGFKPFEILESDQLTPTVKKIRVKPSSGWSMPRGSTFYFNFAEPNSSSIRSFTPTSWSSNHLEFMIRTYPFPMGQVAKYICTQPSHSSVLGQGPVAEYDIQKLKDENIRDIIMVAGGTGIAPCFQVLKLVFENFEISELPSIRIFYGNKTPDEILLIDELSELQQISNGKLSLKFYVDDNPISMAGVIEGRSTMLRDIQDSLVNTSRNTCKIFVSGPPGMMNAICGSKPSEMEQGMIGGLMKRLNFSQKQVYKF